MSRPEDILFQLLRVSTGLQPVECDLSILSKDEWQKIIDLAFEQGVDAISVDGYNSLVGNEDCLLDTDELEDLRLDWFGSVLQVEADYKRYVPKVNSLCKLFTDNGFRPVLLKGLGLGMDYSIPEQRPVGDIDVFLADGRSLEGDQMIKEKLGLNVKKSRIGHHSHFVYKGLSVENHYELSNSYFGGKRTRQLEERLKGLISQDLRKPSENCPYYLPSANFNAVFLMWHMGTHFCTESISLRQLCDWYYFLKAHHSEIDWALVKGIWQDAGMTAFAQAICGLMRKHFLMPEEWMSVELSANAETDADRVLEDILFGARRNGNGVFNILHYKRSGWKYKLVTGQSWVKPMMDSVFMHVLRGGDLKEMEI